MEKDNLNRIKREQHFFNFNNRVQDKNLLNTFDFNQYNGMTPNNRIGGWNIQRHHMYFCLIISIALTSVAFLIAYLVINISK